MIRHTDWNGMDWGRHGVPQGTAPKEPVSAADLDAWVGGTGGARFLPQGYHRGLHWKIRLPLAAPEGVQNLGFLPEHFPLAYDPFLLAAATAHPQMLQLQRALHGDAGPLRLDHAVMLNRPAGPSSGGTWHSHQYSMDDSATHDSTAGTGLFLVRTLCFPDGVTPGTADRPATVDDTADPTNAGGMVGMVAGAHNYKDPHCNPHVPAGYPDAALREAWLTGKFDTDGQPLHAVYPPLPPGSLMCFVHWMPHGWTTVDSGTRWAMLLTYRNMDPRRRILCTPQIPWDWAEERHPRTGRADALTMEQYTLIADTPENGGHGPQGRYSYGPSVAQT
jgi:hypothetical protein